MALATLLHVLGVVVWVGGMFFAYMALRPVAAAQLQPPQRLPLWAGVFKLFFPWVWISVALILVSGLYLVMLLGGFGVVPMNIHAMFGIGLVMMLVFCFVYFVPYGKLARAVAAQDWKQGGEALGTIRKMIGFNLMLGLINIAVAAMSRMTF
ncbi:MAG: CopD family protein [Betaproteobacteria bacterium]|nr:CopD family protein [Betaproteobacteria bacterium]